MIFMLIFMGGVVSSFVCCVSLLSSRLFVRSIITAKTAMVNTTGAVTAVNAMALSATLSPIRSMTLYSSAFDRVFHIAGGSAVLRLLLIYILTVFM